MAPQLERRIRYFLNSHSRGREDVRASLSMLREYGRLVLIGGMLRDIALFGNAGFKSDLDFVIDPENLLSFEKCMRTVGAKINRFGGYSLPSKKWQIDIWPLQHTWANREGYVHVRTVDDLREVTFFNCDAIIYDLVDKRLSAKSDYFHDLNNKILEINLRPNPNPMGNAVRAIRYALVKGFRWGPKLSLFMAEAIDEFGWNTLREYEMRSFRTNYFDTLRLQELHRHLTKRLSMSGDLTMFDPADFRKNVQIELPYLR
jgi:hypothetical protein